MHVATVGGGPGGLYASLLLQKAHPDWEITVYERNPADETYGWGIVFPNRALPNLEEADPESHRRITDAFYRWDPIDTFVDERQYRCSGHTFASMMRTNLLSILQERCRELGVDLRFEAAVEDPAALAAEADLVLGADGIGSRVRETYADAFGTSVVEGTDRFAWFGTDQHFEALTHTFDHNEDGVWRIHAYPGETTTFVVDCDEATWANAGLEDASQAEYVAYLEEVFAGYLDGHDVLCEDDRWWTFRTVRNETWVHENVALVGDAAHSAHFSIGSGTTLAMGDAIALAEAFADVGDDAADADLAEALASYEAERKPFVGKIQEAAELSRVHYEHSQRYLDLLDLQFTVHHLTRSGRITFDSLRRRDPEFVDDYTRWFAENTVGPAAERDGEVAPPGLQPYVLGGTTFPNRTVLPVAVTARDDGAPDDATATAVADAAAARPGLVLAGAVAVDADAASDVAATGDADAAVDADGDRDADTAVAALETPAQADAWADMVAGARARDEETRLGLRLTHPTADVSPEDRRAFVAAAERAGEAGFDVLELDFGFDALGAPLRRETVGSTDARRTLPLEVVSAVRRAWDGPLFARLPATDDAGDYAVEDAFDAADALVARGADLITTTGYVTPVEGVEHVPATVDLAADWVRNEARVPTLSTRTVTSRDDLDTLVGAGRADLVTFDPEASEEVDVEAAESLAEELL
ncbi:MAG: FAD-dependent monooxygenase [Haloferacaceae archaeon]